VNDVEPHEVLSTFAAPVVVATRGVPPDAGVTVKMHVPPSSNTPVTYPPTTRSPVLGSTVAIEMVAVASSWGVAGVVLGGSVCGGSDGWSVCPPAVGVGDGVVGLAEGDGVAVVAVGAAVPDGVVTRSGEPVQPDMATEVAAMAKAAAICLRVNTTSG